MKLTEIFHSLQGEGTNIGLPTIFIRFAGCNLDCSWCDTDYAKEEGTEYSREQVLKELEEKYPQCRRVCITGGEPLCQLAESKALMDKLLDLGYEIVLETNGSIDIEPLSGIIDSPGFIIAMDVKPPSSGEKNSFKSDNLRFISKKDMLKFVIADEADYEFVKKFIHHLNPDCGIILTAEGGTRLKWLAEKVIDDKLDARVLPQLHKLIWGADAKGV